MVRDAIAAEDVAALIEHGVVQDPQPDRAQQRVLVLLLEQLGVVAGVLLLWNLQHSVIKIETNNHSRLHVVRLLRVHVVQLPNLLPVLPHAVLDLPVRHYVLPFPVLLALLPPSLVLLPA